jgi:outer membrane protein assembly factor BamB
MMMKNRNNAKPHRTYFLLLILLLTGLAMMPGLADAAGPGLASTAWPTFQHDLRHTGQSPYLAAQDNSIRWAYPTNSAFRGSAAIGGDGTIYVNSYATNMKLFAINPDGSLKWSRDTSHCSGAPAIGANGTIYVAATTQLLAYNLDGSLKWSLNASTLSGSPVIGDDGTIYFGAATGGGAGLLYAVRDNGASATIKWTYNSGEIRYSTPAIGNGGTIYVGTVYNNLHAITDAGDHAVVKWVLSTNGSMRNCPPAIGADGTIYIGSDSSGSLYAVTDNGANATVKWRYETGWSIQSSPAIGSNGTIYVGSSQAAGSPYSLHAINPDGSRKWAFDAGGDTVSSSPALGSDGTIYIGNYYDDTVLAIRDNGASGALKWSYLTGDAVLGSPAIGADGTVYIGSYDGKFYAFNNHPYVPPATAVTSINPDHGIQGQTLDNVIITGANFTGATRLSFGDGITINSFRVVNSRQIGVNITITPGAAAGPRDVMVTSPTGTGRLNGGFTVIYNATTTTSHGSSSPAVPQGPVQLPSITVRSASLSSGKVGPGTPVTVTANVANTGAVNGATRLTLYVNGQEESVQGINVNSDSSTPVTFSVSRNDPGTYTVYVGGTNAGSFTVDQFADSNMILYVSGTLILFAFAIGVIYTARKRQPGR